MQLQKIQNQLKPASLDRTVHTIVWDIAGPIRVPRPDNCLPTKKITRTLTNKGRGEIAMDDKIKSTRVYIKQAKLDIYNHMRYPKLMPKKIAIDDRQGLYFAVDGDIHKTITFGEGLTLGLIKGLLNCERLAIEEVSTTYTDCVYHLLIRDRASGSKQLKPNHYAMKFMGMRGLHGPIVVVNKHDWLEFIGEAHEDDATRVTGVEEADLQFAMEDLS
jgi:hypothetical protein